MLLSLSQVLSTGNDRCFGIIADINGLLKKSYFIILHYLPSFPDNVGTGPCKRESSLFIMLLDIRSPIRVEDSFSGYDNIIGKKEFFNYM